MSDAPVQHLYAHIPFCPHICPYCAFHVLPARREGAERVVELLIGEHRRIARDLSPSTIFLGGGTPTALSTAMLDRLLAVLLPPSSPGDPREITSECNPSTLSLPKAGLMLRRGVNRLSVGAQSFDPDVLRTLGRTHSAEAIRECARTARSAGFSNLNLDLIFGVPGQTLESWERTLRSALELTPQHVSCYGLTYEEDTAFFERRQRGDLPSDPDLEAAMFRRADAILTEAGFRHYEISNYARPGFESRHNLAYWRGEDYHGIGPSAVSTLRGVRRTNTKFDGDGWKVGEEEFLSQATLAAEAMALGLRTSDGVLEASFSTRFGFRPSDRWKSEIPRLVEQGLMVMEPSLRLTPRGFEMADEIAVFFV